MIAVFSFFFSAVIADVQAEYSAQRTSNLPYQREITQSLSTNFSITQKYLLYCILLGDFTIFVDQFAPDTEYLPNIIKISNFKLHTRNRFCHSLEHIFTVYSKHFFLSCVNFWFLPNLNINWNNCFK